MKDHRFAVLDIFRGLFATLVFFYHLAPLTDTALFNNSLVNSLDIFVDFFFVLSGFVITYRYESLQSFTDFTAFFRKRFFRLYPLHLSMLLIFVSMEGIKVYLSSYIQVNQPDNPHNNVYNFLSSLVLLNSTALFGAKDMSWNIPSWSISAEMIAYLTFGLTMLLLSTTQSRARRNLFYGLVLLLTTSALVLATGEYKLSYGYNYGFLRGIIGFFMGVICFNFFRCIYKSWSTLPAVFFSVAEACILLLLAVAVWQGELLKPVGLLYELLFFLCIVFFAFEKGILSDSLKKVLFLQRIGRYSYSIYLTHAFVNSAFNVLFIRVLHFPPSAYFYLFIPNYALVYWFSAWTYHNIEMYFQGLGQVKVHPKAIRVALSTDEKS